MKILATPICDRNTSDRPISSCTVTEYFLIVRAPLGGGQGIGPYGLRAVLNMRLVSIQPRRAYSGTLRERFLPSFRRFGNFYSLFISSAAPLRAARYTIKIIMMMCEYYHPAELRANSFYGVCIDVCM